MKKLLALLLPISFYGVKAQNVGIGTGSPEMSLHIQDGNNNKLLIENSQNLVEGSTNAVYFKSGGQYTAAIKTTGQPMAYARLGFFTYTDPNPGYLQERLSILDNGFIGINNTNPQAALAIKSGGRQLEIDNPAFFTNGNSTDLYFKITGKQTNSIRSIVVGTTTARLGFFSGTSDNSNNQAEIMSVNDNGVGIGITAPLANLHIYANSSIGKPQLLLEETETEFARIKMKNSTGTYWDIAGKGSTTNANGLLNLYFFNGTTGADKFSLAGTGNLWIAGTLTQNSDERLKKDISTLDNSIQKIEQVSGYHYNWKDADRDSSLQTGVLAQEIEKVMPELVSHDQQGVKSVNYIGMVPYLIEAIKTLQHEVDELKTKHPGE